MVLAKLHFSFLDWRDSGKYGILVLLGQAFQWLGIPGISSLQFSRSGNKWDSDLGGCCCSVTKLCLTLNPWTAARQATLSFTISQSLLKFMSIESVRLSNHLILCCPLILPSIFPSIRVCLFQWVSSLDQVANTLQLQHQSAQWIFREWSINKYSLGLTGLISLLSKGLSRIF